MNTLKIKGGTPLGNLANHIVFKKNYTSNSDCDGEWKHTKYIEYQGGYPPWKSTKTLFSEVNFQTSHFLQSTVHPKDAMSSFEPISSAKIDLHRMKACGLWLLRSRILSKTSCFLKSTSHPKDANHSISQFEPFFYEN